MEVKVKVLGGALLCSCEHSAAGVWGSWLWLRSFICGRSVHRPDGLEASPRTGQPLEEHVSPL